MGPRLESPMSQDSPLRIATGLSVAVALGLVFMSLWWFSHPRPCAPDQTHCDFEFTGDATFRALTLGGCIATGLACGMVWWLGTALARRMLLRRKR